MRAAVARPARIAAFWFGIQTVWSAILGVALQSRITALAPHDALAIYGIVAAIGASTGAVVQLVAGIWSDRRVRTSGNRRAFYLAGTAIAIVAIGAFFTASSVPALLAAFVLLQLGMNVASGPYQAAIPDAIAPAERGAASAWMSTLSFAGSIAGLAIAVLLDGPRAALALIASLVAGAAISLAHLRRLPAVSVRAGTFRLTRDIGILLLSRGAINVGFYTLFGFLFFFVRESLRVPDARTTTGLLFITFTLAAAAGGAVSGPAADRFDKRLVVAIAAIVLALAVGAFAAAPDAGVAFGAAAVAGAAWGAFFTADWAIAYALLPGGAMAAALGVWNLATALPQVIAPALTAPLVAAVDARSPGAGPRVALALVGVEFLIGAALLWLIPRVRFEPQREEGAASR